MLARFESFQRFRIDFDGATSFSNTIITTLAQNHRGLTNNCQPNRDGGALQRPIDHIQCRLVISPDFPSVRFSGFPPVSSCTHSASEFGSGPFEGSLHRRVALPSSRACAGLLSSSAYDRLSQNRGRQPFFVESNSIFPDFDVVVVSVPRSSDQPKVPLGTGSLQRGILVAAIQKPPGLPGRVCVRVEGRCPYICDHGRAARYAGRLRRLCRLWCASCWH